MHISDQVTNELIEQGWTVDAEGRRFQKTIDGFEEGGTVSNGRRVVNLFLDEGGRWFERHDGWGKVVRDVDLRQFPNNAPGAIRAVLS